MRIQFVEAYIQFEKLDTFQQDRRKFGTAYAIILLAHSVCFQHSLMFISAHVHIY